MPAASLPIIESIVGLHFEEAAFLWTQRELVARSPGSSLADLVAVDERLESHVDGLRVAGEPGWSACEEGLNPDDPGALFVCAVLAFESGVKDRIEKVVVASNESRPAFSAAVSALGWMNTQRFNALIGSLVTTSSRRYRRLGIAACGIRRVNPRGYLDQAVNSSDLYLRTRALRTAGELKRVDLLPLVKTHLQHEDDACRFEAVRTACLLGDRSALNTLGTFVLSNSEFTLPALQVALRLADGQTAKNWLKAMSQNAELVRAMLTGVGFTGDPVYVPMLIKQMENPVLARLSGGSFSLITGADLDAENLAVEQPGDFASGPNDDPADDNTDMDMDDELPWPNAPLVGQWWQQHMGNFAVGTRYLAGKPVSPDHCMTVLSTGKQLHRTAAAMELALSRPDAQWFNTLAPGSWHKSE